MAMIQITPELLMAKANEVRGMKNEHDQIMSKLKTLVHSLNDQWKGEAQDAFVAKFDSMQSQFTQFSEMLEGYAKLMETTAEGMGSKDVELKNRIQGFS